MSSAKELLKSGAIVVGRWLGQTVYQRGERPAGVTFENWDLVEVSKPLGIA